MVSSFFPFRVHVHTSIQAYGINRLDIPDLYSYYRTSINKLFLKIGIKYQRLFQHIQFDTYSERHMIINLIIERINAI